MAVNPDKNIVEQSLIARLIGKIKRIALDISDDVSAEETRAMAAEAAAKTVVTAGENCSVTKTTASDGHDVYTIDADGKPQVQADWNQADSSNVDYIKNKPDLSLKEDVANKATTVRQSGSADDTHFPSEAAVRSAIDSAVSAAYKAAGTKRAAELTSSLFVAANEGNVYNITEAGTTDNNFVDGAGKTINVGDNVGVCKVGNDYKFDLLSGFVDLSDYLTKTGDGSNVTITPDGSSGTTFSSGGKLSELAQKFINLVSSLKALAFKDKVSDGDIDGVISASHIPDAIKDKIVFIDGTITSSGGSYSVSCNTTYEQVAAMVDPSVGKYPVCRFALGSQTYYFTFHLGVPSGSHLRYTFGSTDVYSGGGSTVSFMTSVYIEPDDVWKFREITYDPTSWVNSLNNKADKTPTFSEASTRDNLAGSNESMTTILGKIKKWFTDLKALAFKDNVGTSDIADDAITADKVKDNETLPVNISGSANRLNWGGGTDDATSIGYIKLATINTPAINAPHAGIIANVSWRYVGDKAKTGEGLLIASLQENGDSTIKAKILVLNNRGSSEAPPSTSVSFSLIKVSEDNYELWGYVAGAWSSIFATVISGPCQVTYPARSFQSTAPSGYSAITYTFIAEATGSYPSMAVGNYTSTGTIKTALDGKENIIAQEIGLTAFNLDKATAASGETHILRFLDANKNNVSGKPVDDSGSVVILSQGGGFVRQVFFSETSGDIYYRYRVNAAWRNWTKISMSSGTYPDMTVGNATAVVTGAGGMSSSNNIGYRKLAQITMDDTNNPTASASGFEAIVNWRAANSVNLTGGGILYYSNSENNDSNVATRLLALRTRGHELPPRIKLGYVRVSSEVVELWCYAPYAWESIFINVIGGKADVVYYGTNYQSSAPTGFTEIPYNGKFVFASGQIGSPTRSVYAKPNGSLEACNFNAAAYHIFNNGVVDNIPDYIFKEYNQFIINNSNLRIYAEQLVENICYKFYNYKGNYCQLSFAKRTNDTYTRVWNSDTATLSTSSWTAWPSLSRPTSGICIVVRIGGTIYVSGY